MNAPVKKDALGEIRSGVIPIQRIRDLIGEETVVTVIHRSGRVVTGRLIGVELADRRRSLSLQFDSGATLPFPRRSACFEEEGGLRIDPDYDRPHAECGFTIRIRVHAEPTAQSA